MTAKRIASDREEWTNYLKTAARLYRYPFREQMLIYAQRPDWAAVASMEIWNNRMNCWVNRGSKGIALIDELNVLGDATTSMCEPVLLDICRVVDSIDLKRARAAQMQRSGTVYQMPENKPEKGLANAPEPDYNALKRESKGVDELSADTQSAENKADTTPQQEAVGRPADNQNAEQNIAENGGNEHGDHLQAGRGLSDTQSGDAGRTGGDADRLACSTCTLTMQV